MPKKQLSAVQRLKAHIQRLEQDPDVDETVLQRLKERLAALGGKKDRAEELASKLMRRNRALSKLSGRKQ